LSSIGFDATLTYESKPFSAASSGLTPAAWNGKGKGKGKGKGVHDLWMSGKFWY
jgi:hypothetical protein